MNRSFRASVTVMRSNQRGNGTCRAAIRVSECEMSRVKEVLTSCVYAALGLANAGDPRTANCLIVHGDLEKPSGAEHQRNLGTEVSAVAARPSGSQRGLECSMSARISTKRTFFPDLVESEQVRIPDEHYELRLDALGSTSRMSLKGHLD
jgi:hypothetical protein